MSLRTNYIHTTKIIKFYKAREVQKVCISLFKISSNKYRLFIVGKQGIKKRKSKTNKKNSLKFENCKRIFEVGWFVVGKRLFFGYQKQIK